MNQDQIVFTPAGVLDLLLQIEELQGLDIGVVDSGDGTIKVNVGDSTYTIDTSAAVGVEVSEDALDTVDDVNESTYQDMSDTGEVVLDDAEPIHSGIIKEALKSLLLGGMIRLSTKLLK